MCSQFCRNYSIPTASRNPAIYRTNKQLALFFVDALITKSLRDTKTYTTADFDA